jgi:hypothetical protein
MKHAFALLLLPLAACSEAGKAPLSKDAVQARAAPEWVNITTPAEPPSVPAPKPLAPDPVTPPHAAAQPRSQPQPSRPFPPSADCQIHGRGDWAAHIDAMPGPNARPRLIVTGTIGVKPAARAELRLDPAVLESNPPQRIVNLVVRLPTEPTIDSLIRREVRGEWPVTPPLGAVRIRCGGRNVASITNIEVAH